MTMLYIPPLPRYSPSEGFALKKAEYDVHNAAMEIVNDVRDTLPSTVKGCAYSATAIGLTTALGRIFAAAKDQHEATISVMNLSKFVAMEQRYWLNRRVLLH